MLLFLYVGIIIFIKMEIIYIPPTKDDKNINPVAIDAELVTTDLDKSNEYNGIEESDTEYSNDYGFLD